MIRCVCLVLVGSWCVVSLAAEDLTVLRTTPDGVVPGKQLEVYLKQELQQQVERRRSDFAVAVQSRGECAQWQQSRREFFLRQLGGLPERTPLNAQVVKRLQGKGYRVENVMFESRPGHHVTANLYLPEQAPAGAKSLPAVLVPCGHSHDGKAAGGYQQICILLARNGMAAFCYDPIGQGERYQMLDFEREHTHFATVPYPLAVPHPRVQHLCTTEHTAMGLSCILLGTNVAQYRIWDGMRAIDYLQSRPDIDPLKIGCTGNSGGGTLTAYLMALDERIVAAAPVCYLTTFERLIATRGPQDAEQNIFGQIAFGMDQPDYVMMRAPKPTLICAGRRDATFDIDGTWDLFRQSKAFYARLGYPERVDLNDADLPHGFYLPQREAVARWMHRWLLGEDREIHEVAPASLPDPITDKQWLAYSAGDWKQADLYCTPDGQTLLLPGQKSVFQLNADLEQQRRQPRSDAWQKLSDGERRDLVRSIIGAPAAPATARAHSHVGSVRRDGYSIQKIVLAADAGLRLPALAFLPAKPNGKYTLYLHGESLQADAGPGGPIEQLVQQRQIVIAAELRGIGETETGHDKQDYGRGYFGRDVQEIFLAYLLGRSYVGMRAGDVTAWTRWLQEGALLNERPREIHLVAIGEAAIPALHAAALEPESFASVRLRQMISSWSEIVATPGGKNQAVNVVHGALLHFDLPDLVKLAGADRVRLEDPVDVYGEPVQNNSTER